eukprot:893806_1
MIASHTGKRYAKLAILLVMGIASCTHNKRIKRIIWEKQRQLRQQKMSKQQRKGVLNVTNNAHDIWDEAEMARRWHACRNIKQEVKNKISFAPKKSEDVVNHERIRNVKTQAW